MAQWFGESWGAPACDPERHAPTPVGAQCVECQKPVQGRDRGVLLPYASVPVTVVAYHLPCFLATLGLAGEEA